MNENLSPKMPRYDEWLAEATKELTEAGFKTVQLDSELILSHTIKKNRTYIHAHPDERLNDRQYEIANTRIALRLDHVPIAYIIGHKEFYGRRFRVTTATLVPRPESEDMIDILKELIGNNLALLPAETWRLVDVGTGCGVLGITAKLEFPELEVTLTDISRHALNVAEENARQLQANVDTLQSDLLDNYPFNADFILANLPYVDKDWQRSPETNHEPELALFAANQGKAVIFRLLDIVKQSLKKGGYLLVEADPEQHDAIIQRAQSKQLAYIKHSDYQLVFRRQD